jgi:hypothetical protein
VLLISPSNCHEDRSTAYVAGVFPVNEAELF